MEVVFLRQFSKDIEKLANPIRKKVAAIIIEVEKADSLEKIPHCKKLKGHPHAYRIRTGDYRIGFYCPPDQPIEMARVVHRKDIYRVFP
jgi:mRNA interferase RelE/StbE